jgi:hypothetical protein
LLTRLGQSDAVIRALEKLDAHSVFKAADLMAYRARRYTELGRSELQAPAICDRYECPYRI